MSMSKKDYELLAQVVRITIAGASTDPSESHLRRTVMTEGVLRLGENLARALADTNESFDIERFREAADLGYTPRGGNV